MPVADHHAWQSRRALLAGSSYESGRFRASEQAAMVDVVFDVNRDGPERRDRRGVVGADGASSLTHGLEVWLPKQEGVTAVDDNESALEMSAQRGDVAKWRPVAVIRAEPGGWWLSVGP